MKLPLYLSMLMLPAMTLAQVEPIVVDGYLDDWQIAPEYDEVGDGSSLDLISFRIANDTDNLYLTIRTFEEFSLNSNNKLELLIDTDNNSSTGTTYNGMGADLIWRFGDKVGSFVANGKKTTIRHGNIGLTALPSVTATEFEISISRTAKPDDTNSLFTADTIGIAFRTTESNGDQMPSNGHYTYVFGTNELAIADTINISKTYGSLLRLMTWNVLDDGLIDDNRRACFGRIRSAIAPDIITFNECWDATTTSVNVLLNEYLPASSGSWYVHKLASGNITASRFPIIRSENVKSGSRITAHHINLPDDMFSTDIVVFNCHLKCCSSDENDQKRQAEADALMQYVNKLKSGNTQLNIEAGTPFVFMGDFNLVGTSQNLHTLLYGDIQDESTYGSSQLPDWDNSPMDDDVARNVACNAAYTYGESGVYYWPSRLDYILYTGSALNVEKSFIMQSSRLSDSLLARYNILAGDNATASDHLPHVADFSIKTSSTDNRQQPDRRTHIGKNVLKKDDELVVSNIQQNIARINIYNIAGMLTNTITVNNGTARTPMSSRGMFIVEIPGTACYKVIVE